MCNLNLIYNSNDIIRDSQTAMEAGQHRGEDSAGLALCQPMKYFMIFREPGRMINLFERYFSGNNSYPRYRSAIGHNRYSTIGPSTEANIQPIKVDNHAVGCNGTIVNEETLRKRYKIRSRIKSDTIVTATILNKTNNVMDGCKECVEVIDGGNNFVGVNNRGELYAFRDPYGFHPLWVAEKDGTWYIASENIAFTPFGIYDPREIKPAEFFIFTNEGQIYNGVLPHNKPHSACSFELFYFLDQGSVFEDRSSQRIRRTAGRRLAELYGVEADVVCPNLNSGLHYALGYAEESGIPMEIGLTRIDLGRTYTHQEKIATYLKKGMQMDRKEKTRRKSRPVKEIVRGKRVIVADDSYVRGNNTDEIVKMLYAIGASEVHVRFGFGQIKNPCFFGKRHSTMKELPAAGYETKRDFERAIEKTTGVKTARFLSTEENRKILGDPKGEVFCLACQTGDYPCEIPDTPRYRKALHVPRD